MNGSVTGSGDNIQIIYIYYNIGRRESQIQKIYRRYDLCTNSVFTEALAVMAGDFSFEPEPERKHC